MSELAQPPPRHASARIEVDPPAGRSVLLRSGRVVVMRFLRSGSIVRCFVSSGHCKTHACADTWERRCEGSLGKAGSEERQLAAPKAM
eukprot:337822-Rhodomonas_salina.2